MNIPLGMIENGIATFILVFVRMAGLFVIAPIFGRRNIPTYYKVGFSLLLAYILVSSVTLKSIDSYNGIYEYVFLVLSEFIVGVTLGYISYIVFTSIYFAGQILDMQIGFGMVNVIDPVSNIQIPITSNFYFITCMLIFLTVNGHHLLITALFESYQILPLGEAVYTTGVLNDLMRLISDIFIIGIKISAPVIAAILISDVALGIVSKTVPQLNVFIVGMPLKIVMGLLVVIITFPMFLTVVDMLIEGMNSEMYQLMKDMVKK